jgi:hypothetical protein
MRRFPSGSTGLEGHYVKLFALIRSSLLAMALTGLMLNAAWAGGTGGRGAGSDPAGGALGPGRAGAMGSVDRFGDWMAEGDQQNAWFGFAVDTAGDVNGDGFADVVVGAFRYHNDQWKEGRAFAYYGSATGLSTTASWTVEDDRYGAWFGHSVATAGDVNGDGYADVIVGAPSPARETKRGRVFVYHGSGLGLSATPNWVIESDQDTAWLGHLVATAGDVNGDGYADVAVGEHRWDDSGQVDQGRAFVYHGSPEGLSATPDWVVAGGQAGANFGRWLGTAGDVNGDGYADLIVGAHFWDNGQINEGRAFAFHGSATGLSTTAAWTAEGDQGGAWFARALGTAGDVNQDGYSDVIVGAPKYDGGQADEGRAFVYYGSATGLSPTAAWTAEVDQAGAAFARRVSSAGDVDGDGYGDLILGAPKFDNGQAGDVTDAGRAFAFLGSAQGPTLEPSWVAGLGQSYSRFGRGIGTAGDVNGDGLSDVIVGAATYDNGEADEGASWVFHGPLSSSGT